MPMIRSAILLLAVVAILDLEYPVRGEGMPFERNVAPEHFPERLKNNPDQPLDKGFLDVTKRPYNARGDGVTDDTDAIQQALDDGFEFNFVVFLPQRTYLVSHPLVCIQRAVTKEGKIAPLMPRGDAIGSQRKFGHLLVGSTLGGKRPTIKVKDGSLGDKELFFFRFQGTEAGYDASRLYIATLRGMDIDMGRNPKAIAITMDGAQHCVIEDVNIVGDFFTGVRDLPGSGGGVVNLTIHGGRVGIEQTQYRPNPTLIGVRLIGQSECGLKVTESRGPVILVGFEIASPKSPSPDYRAVYGKNTRTILGDHGMGNLCLIDGAIEVTGAAGKAIYNYAQDFVVRNVYIKAATMIESGLYQEPGQVVAGDPARWKKISEYDYTSAMDKAYVYHDDRTLWHGDTDVIYQTPAVDENPPDDLVTRHTWGMMPSWEDAGVVDIVKDYGATPEHVKLTDNDALAIQRAIDDTSTPGHPNYGKTVFIPRGHFLLYEPLVVRRGVKLIGAGKNISVLQMAKAEWERTYGAAVQTVDDPEGKVVLSDFAVLGLSMSSYLEVRSGKSLVRDLVTESGYYIGPQNSVPDKPYVLFAGHASSRVYHISLDHIAHDRLPSGPGQDQSYSGYHLLQIRDTPGPLVLYQVSIEHLPSSPQMDISQCQNVTVYGLKFELRRELLSITNARDIAIIGGSGNYGIDNPKDRAIILITNSSDVLVAGFCKRTVGKAYLRDKPWLIDGTVRVPSESQLGVYERRSSNARPARCP